MAITNNKEEENSMHHSFYDLPEQKEREQMEVLELAELLSSVEEGTPPYIVLTHELNMKIAKEQSKATLSASWIGATAVIISALVTAFFGFLLATSKPCEPNQTPEYKKSSSTTQKGIYKKTSGPIQAAAFSTSKQITVPLKDTNNSNSSKNRKNNKK